MKPSSMLRTMILYNPFINKILVKRVYFANGSDEEFEFENTKGCRLHWDRWFIGWV